MLNNNDCLILLQDFISKIWKLTICRLPYQSCTLVHFSFQKCQWSTRATNEAPNMHNYHWKFKLWFRCFNSPNVVMCDDESWLGSNPLSHEYKPSIFLGSMCSWRRYNQCPHLPSTKNMCVVSISRLSVVYSLVGRQ